MYILINRCTFQQFQLLSYHLRSPRFYDLLCFYLSQPIVFPKPTNLVEQLNLQLQKQAYFEPCLIKESDLVEGESEETEIEVEGFKIKVPPKIKINVEQVENKIRNHFALCEIEFCRIYQIMPPFYRTYLVENSINPVSLWNAMVETSSIHFTRLFGDEILIYILNEGYKKETKHILDTCFQYKKFHLDPFIKLVYQYFKVRCIRNSCLF